jgi:hypothetical protein
MVIVDIVSNTMKWRVLSKVRIIQNTCMLMRRPIYEAKPKMIVPLYNT